MTDPAAGPAGQPVAVAPGTQSHHVVLDRSRLVIPIVFVPGVMGSRLRLNSADGEEVLKWDPDSPISMLPWVTASAVKERGALGQWNGTLIREPLASAREPLDRPGRWHGSVRSREARGWGTVVWSFYGGILEELENLNGTLGSIASPVWAFGYDWRKSNKKSGEELKKFIDDVIEQEQCSKVIVVTHSMGGIVTRSACHSQAGLADKVAAVIHNVQPANGAAIAYARFLVGTTDIAEPLALNIILGTAWFQYTAIMSGARGPVQLLPTAHYGPVEGGPGGFSQWLSMSGTAVADGDHWADYVRADSPGLLRPWNAGVHDFSQAEWSQVLSDLRETLADAGRFHTDLGLYTHPNTFVSASASNPTCVGVDARSVHVMGYDELQADLRMGPGDGTVPHSSAEAIQPAEDGQSVSNPKHSTPPRLLLTRGEHGKIFDQSPDIRRFIEEAIRYTARRVQTRPAT